MATEKQKAALSNLVENRRNNNPKTLGEILLASGYSESTAIKPSQVMRSKGWQELLDDINDDSLLKELKDVAHDKKDKRAKLQAIDMLLDLKGRYPNQKNEATFIDTIKKLNE